MVSFELDRDGKKMTIQSRVEYDEQAQRNKVGVSPVFKHSLAEGTVNGVKNTGKMTVMMYDILKKLVTGEVSVKELSTRDCIVIFLPSRSSSKETVSFFV